MTESPVIDVVIPVYKPGEEFLTVLERLLSQKVQISKIILINTEKRYFEEKYRFDSRIMVKHISKKEFDHAKTRDMGLKLSNADYVLFMTQDAIPCDDKLTQELLLGFNCDKKVAVSYARQLPKKDCKPEEVFTRNFNYPKNSRVKGQENLEELGIKLFFCSDVCAMYDREVYLSNGGFEGRAIFNEDMVYAAKVIFDGLYISYCANAKVLHSHNYTAREQFRRNFDLGVSQALHPEVFLRVKSESEGVKMVKSTAKYLLKTGKWYRLFYLIWVSAFKYMGYKKGLNYKKYSRKKILKYTMNPGFWN